MKENKIMKNRGTISTARIAEKLKKVEGDLGISRTNTFEHNSDSPLLFINGRLDRKNRAYTAKNFAILEQLNEEVKKYCKGVDLAILNYLIAEGLNRVKESNKLISIEYSDFESNIESELE